MTDMTEIRYRPKGSMCATCVKCLLRNCSNLPFSMMPVIGHEDGWAIVKCSDYERLSKKAALAAEKEQK